MFTTVHKDNNGALHLANMEPGRMTPRSKHYGVKYHWFRSKLDPNNICVVKIDTKLQQADDQTINKRLLHAVLPWSFVSALRYLPRLCFLLLPLCVERVKLPNFLSLTLLSCLQLPSDIRDQVFGTGIILQILVIVVQLK